MLHHNMNLPSPATCLHPSSSSEECITLSEMEKNRPLGNFFLVILGRFEKFLMMHLES